MLPYADYAGVVAIALQSDGEVLATGQDPVWQVVFEIRDFRSNKVRQKVRVVGTGVGFAYGGAITLVGPPANLHVTKIPGGTFDGIWGEAGDLTGDHHPDMLVKEDTDGSGGGGTWLVLESGTVVRKIFQATTSDTDLAIVAGTLHITAGVYGKADPQCCPTFTRRTILRWNGETWVTVASHLTRNRS